LDRSYPDSRLGSLTRAFQRPREPGKCPYCGWTAAKAKDLGLVGCPLCYEALEASLWPEFGIHLVAP
jgi:protein-arginine kinase activator protein McsA